MSDHLLKGSLGEAIMRQWREIDMDEPEVAWAAVEERFREEARINQRSADSRRRDAKDALEQAELHQARADDFRQLADAIARAPVTFPVRDSGRPPKGEDAPAAECEAGQSGAAETAHRPTSSAHQVRHGG